MRAESRGYDGRRSSNDIDGCRKRDGYLSWDDYFLAVAYLSARRSKDPAMDGMRGRGGGGGGACVVDALGRIVGIGYDGFPRGCSDDCLPWASASTAEGEDEKGGSSSASLPWLRTKEPYLCRAEINAILNKCSSDVVGGRMFVPNFPCECFCSYIRLFAFGRRHGIVPPPRPIVVSISRALFPLFCFSVPTPLVCRRIILVQCYP